jgi:hypothetical protein
MSAFLTEAHEQMVNFPVSPGVARLGSARNR